MTDVSVGEMPIEPVPSIPPGPEATAELERAVQAAEVPAGDTGEVETEVVESFDPRVSIPETLGPVRRAILEGLIDGEGALSVAELHALMPLGTPRGTVEAAILREYRSGRIERVGPGLYVLAKPKPAEQPKSARQPPPTPIEEALWRRDAGEPLTEIARSYNVSHSTISRLPQPSTVASPPAYQHP